MTSSSTLCKIGAAAGAPGTGVHSARVFGIAAFDLLLTIAAALAIASATGWNGWLVFAALIVLGIGVHWLFCVPTALNTALGLT